MSESASKLDALHTLRAHECLHRAIISHGTYDPEHLGCMSRISGNKGVNRPMTKD